MVGPKLPKKHCHPETRKAIGGFMSHFKLHLGVTMTHLELILIWGYKRCILTVLH